MAVDDRVVPRIFEYAFDGMLLTRPDGSVLKANASACRLLARTEEEICALGRAGLVVETPELRELVARRATGKTISARARFRRGDGTTFLAEFTSGIIPATEGDAPYAYVIFRDVSELERSRERLERTNRSLALVSRCNEAMVRAQTEQGLYEAVCELMVSRGGYALCWVGLAQDDAGRSVRPVARAGRDDGFVDGLNVTWADELRGQGPAGRAIRLGKAVQVSSLADDPAFAPWREAALARGFSSAVSLPLLDGDRPIGALCMYSAAPAPADVEEFEFLAELASDLSWGTKALRERDARDAALRLLEGLAEGVPDPLFVKDRESRWLFVNRATLEVAGRSRAEVLGRSDLEIYPDAQVAEALVAVDRRVVESGVAEVIEERVKAPEGYRTYLSTKAPYRDEHGRIIGVVGSAHDITARKQAEGERERLATAITQSAEAVVITNRAGDIVYVNPAFEAVTGYGALEIVGKNPRVLKSDEHDEAFYEAMWAVLKRGETWRGQLVNRKKNGQLYTEEATISPIRNQDGEVDAYVAVKRDVTRDLELRQQLLQSQKLEGLGQLAGGVAHDFNNILSVILSVSEVTLEGLQEEDPLKVDMEEVRDAAERAAGLTRQLLAFSRKQVLQLRCLDLNEVLENMQRLLRRLLGESVELRIDPDPRAGQVKADLGQLEQVVMNLAINARDAMPRGGTLTLTTRVLTEAKAPSTPLVELRVSDTGAGMDEAVQARIFEPFFTTKAVGQGTGLGLSTVYGIVAQSGGQVRVESSPGHGTSFIVTLPRCSGEAEDLAPTAAVVEEARGGETVLVVEDDPAVRAVIRRALSGAGYVVLTAANAGEALLLFERASRTVDLVVTDVVMPLMNGRELVDRLRQAQPRLRALLISGYPSEEPALEGVFTGGFDFFPKPIKPSELLRHVRQVLNRSLSPPPQAR